jgi:TRAP transporter T-component
MLVRTGGLAAVVVLSLLSAGCLTDLAAGSTVKIIGRASPSIARFEDPDLAEEAIPGSIGTMEGLLEIRPDDTNLRTILARSYASYGFGFLEDRMEQAIAKDDEAAAEHYRRRAGMAFTRARELALGNLTIWEDDGGGAKGHIQQGLAAWNEYLNQFDDAKDHAPTLFWAAYAWIRYIGLNRDDVNALADLPFVNALADRVYALDPTFMGNAPQALRAGLMGSPPAQLGGRPKEAKQEFDAAIAATGGKNLMYMVMEARIVAVALQDRALYKKLLTTVIDAPVDLDVDQRLSNQLAKRRATRYLAEVDQLFEPEPPAEPTAPPAPPEPPPVSPAAAPPPAPAPAPTAPPKVPAAPPKAPVPAAAAAPKAAKP